jgi:hypothetical protein
LDREIGEEHNCNEMKEAAKELREGSKLEINYLDGYYLQVTIETYDSSYGEGEDVISIPVKLCPFCGVKLLNTI